MSGSDDATRAYEALAASRFATSPVVTADETALARGSPAAALVVLSAVTPSDDHATLSAGPRIQKDAQAVLGAGSFDGPGSVSADGWVVYRR